jgi:hypothetical protein
MANVPFRNLELNNLSFKQLQYISTNNSVAPNGYFMASVSNIIIPRDPVTTLSTYANVDLNNINSTFSTYAVLVPQISTNTDTALRLAQAAGPAISTLSTSVGGAINTLSTNTGSAINSLSNATATSIISLGNSISTVSTNAGIAQQGVNSLGISLSTISTSAGTAFNMSGSISSISTFTGNNTMSIISLGNTISSQSTVLGNVEIGLSTVSTSAALNIGPTGPTGPTGPAGDNALWAAYTAVADVRVGASTIRDFMGMVMSTNTLGGNRCVVFGSNNSTFGTGSLMMGTNNVINGYINNTYDFVGGRSNSVISSLGYNTVIGDRANLYSSQFCVVGGQENTVSSCSYSYCAGGNNDIRRAGVSHIDGVNHLISNIQYTRVSGCNHTINAGILTQTVNSRIDGERNTVIGGPVVTCAIDGIQNTIDATSGIIINASHAEGYTNIITKSYSHAEGAGNTISGEYSHAEGTNNFIYDSVSHAEGDYNTIFAGATGSHVEGFSNRVYGRYAHAEGTTTYLTGAFGHTEGLYTSSLGIGAHAEGNETIAASNASHAAGIYSIARIPGSYTYTNTFLPQGAGSSPLKGTAQTSLVTMRSKTTAGSTPAAFVYYDPGSNAASLFGSFTTLSNINMTVSYGATSLFAQTFNVAITGVNSNVGGGTAGKGFFYSEYRASLYYDVLGTLYVGNLVAGTYTAATAGAITLSAANAANNLQGAPTITVRATAGLIGGGPSARIAFDVQSSTATPINYYAHIRMDEVMRP